MAQGTDATGADKPEFLYTSKMQITFQRDQMLDRSVPLRVGFISTRFSGTDGVSLETEKWAHVLESMGHHCFYFAGECDRPAEVSYVVPEAFFRHPSIDALNTIAYGEPWSWSDPIRARYSSNGTQDNSGVAITIRPPKMTHEIQVLKEHLKQEIEKFLAQYQIQLLIVENALSIPLNIPLGLALTELVAETGIPTIAHHHDFYWERKRFLVNCVGDYLRMSFPPVLPAIRHVTISSWAASELSLRSGASATVIPNVMHFEKPPPPQDEYSASLRADLGLQKGEYLILQPTRVVQRKGIEHAIELVRRMALPAHLVISHASGDEGTAYERRIHDYAELMGVKTRFVANIIRQERSTTPDGRRVYSLADVFTQADLVTYPSEIEGFGNAFLEAIYYRRPIVVSDYSIYAIDIRPKGFRAIEFDGFISDETVRQARYVLENPAEILEMTQHNYQLGERFFSYCVLEHRLSLLIASCFGETC